MQKPPATLRSSSHRIHGIGVALFAIVPAGNPRFVPLVFTICSRRGDRSCLGLPRITRQEASQRPTTLQILVVDDTIRRGTGQPYLHVFRNREEVVVRNSTGRQQWIGVAIGSNCRPRRDTPLLGLLSFAELLVLQENLPQPRGHQVDEGAEDYRTSDEEQKDNRSIPELLPGTRFVFAMSAVAAALHLADGAVEPRSFRRQCRRGEQGKRCASLFRGAVASHVPIVDEGGDEDSRDADRINGPTIRFSPSEFHAVVDRAVMDQRMMMIARQIMEAVIRQRLGAIEDQERLDEDWKDGCHFLSGGFSGVGDDDLEE